MQLISLTVANILPKVFEFWSFPYISLTFRNKFGLLGLYVDLNGKILSFFSFFHFKVAHGELQELFQFPFQQPFLDIFEFSEFFLFLKLHLFKNVVYYIVEMHLARQNSIFLRKCFTWLKRRDT